MMSRDDHLTAVPKRRMAHSARNRLLRFALPMSLAHALVWLYVVGTLFVQGDRLPARQVSPMLTKAMWILGAPLIFVIDEWQALTIPVLGDIPSLILFAALNGLLWGLVLAVLATRLSNTVRARRAAA